ncbi:Trp biosynthesis-associated membrane protein [Mycetocola zhujimingii]|nr:Trp biosynthesis-associated membrane protein [Mycetocola zhujimingii]
MSEVTPDDARSGKRVKYTLMLLALALAGLTLIAWTQQWLTVALAAPARDELAVDGAVAAPALAALALASLALGAALAIAGIGFRYLLGILEVVLGASVALSAVLVFTDPVGAAGAAVTDATGIAGTESIAALVDSAAVTPWPAITLVLGIATAITGIGIVVTARSWPRSSKKYSAVRLEPVATAEMPDAVDSWDDLTRGDDPTK